MNPSLLLALSLSALPAVAADLPPPPPAAAKTGSEPNVPLADQQPNPGSDGGVTPYALKDLDAVLKEDQKRLEADLRDAVKMLDAQYEAQKDLESRQLKAKFDFLKKIRDERVSFEHAQIDEWRKFGEKLRAVEPAERGTEKLVFDQKSLELRHKFEVDAQAKNKEFMEKQQVERDQFWAKLQKENNEAALRQQEHATKWGKPSAPH